MIDWTYHGYRGRQRKLASDYLEFWCDFLTIPAYAAYLGTSEQRAHKRITKGRALFNATFGPVA